MLLMDNDVSNKMMIHCDFSSSILFVFSNSLRLIVEKYVAEACVIVPCNQDMQLSSATEQKSHDASRLLWHVEQFTIFSLMEENPLYNNRIPL